MAVVLVHGAYHGPWVWEPLVAELADLTTRTVTCPSSAAELGSLADDVAALNEVVADLDEPAVVVAHSFGGLVATEALADSEQVSKIVYVAAFVPEIGESGADIALAAEGAMHHWSLHNGDDPANAYLEFPRELARESFFDDVAPDLAEDAIARLTPASLTAFTTPVTRAAWHEIPTSYVLCTQDRILTPASQQPLAKRTGRVHRLTSSHSPMLSRPRELARLIRHEADETTQASLR